MNDFKVLAHHIAEILKGNPQMSNSFITILRLKEITATIDGRETKASLHSSFSFEAPDKDGKTLNLGEVVLLQEEITPFIKALLDNNITISALHNHWIFDQPKLYYLHFQSIDYPITFSRYVEHAFETIESKRPPHLTVGPIVKIR